MSVSSPHFLPQAEGPYPCKVEACPCRYYKRAGDANKHMAVEHGIKPPSAYLYPPKPKKPKNKRVKRSTEEGAAGMRSMPTDNSCAYHLAGMALYASRHLDHPDIDQWTSQVAGTVRSIVIDNFLNIRDRVVKIVPDCSLGEHDE